MINDALGYSQLPWERFKMSKTWNHCRSKLGEFVLIITKQKTQPNILPRNLSWRELDLFTSCYSALLWKEFEVPVMKITLFLDLMKQIHSELDLLIPNTELKFAVSCDLWWLKLGLWHRLILEKAEVKLMGLNRLGWNCKVLFCLWRKT